jgi:hypothetical protein
MDWRGSTEAKSTRVSAEQSSGEGFALHFIKLNEELRHSRMPLSAGSIFFENASCGEEKEK